MPDGDGIGAHQNLLDEVPNDFPTANQIEALCIVLQSCTEVVEAVSFFTPSCSALVSFDLPGVVPTSRWLKCLLTPRFADRTQGLELRSHCLPNTCFM